jgi:transmembrane 9 superfamily protein 3
MMVVFLCGLVALILLRTLKNDYARYTSEDVEMDLERVDDQVGWKQIHGDVFRAPKYLLPYSAMIGTGCQLGGLALCAIVRSMLNTSDEKGGSPLAAFFVCYSLTSFLAGYAGASFYKRHGGIEWKRCMFATAVLYPSICFAVAILVNILALAHDAVAAFAIDTLLLVALIWACVSCPLVLVGTILGRQSAQAGDFPCRVNSLRRPIPEGAWYTRSYALVLASGILPFGSIFIEMYFVFTSFWNYRFEYVYAFTLLVFLILLVVTVCVTIVSTYVLLNNEDHRWHWTAFMSGGSTAFYVYLYAMYYYTTHTRIEGVMPTLYYFATMAVFCVALFLLTGTVGVIGTNIFIRRIYAFIKSD